MKSKLFEIWKRVSGIIDPRPRAPGWLLHFENIVEKRYPDNHEFHIIKPQYWNHIGVTIHFPEITVTSSYGKTHIVRDIFATIGVLAPRNLRALACLYFRRSTYTAEEKYYGYFHSHVTNSGVTDCNYTDKICFGSSMKLPVNEKAKAVFLLAILEDFLMTEYTVGGPFRSLTSLVVGNKPVRLPSRIYICDDDDRILHKFAPYCKICNGKVWIAQEDVASVLYTNRGWLQDDYQKLLTVSKVNGEWWTTVPSKEGVEVDRSEYILFKGKKHYLTILPSGSDHKGKEKIHPIFLIQIQKYIIYEYTKRFQRWIKEEHPYIEERQGAFAYFQ